MSRKRTMYKWVVVVGQAEEKEIITDNRAVCVKKGEW